MRIMVTGGAGYIGSVAVRELLDRGHEVMVLDNFENGHLLAVDRRALSNMCDLRVMTSVMREMTHFQPDAVMHFAALALVGESMQCPLHYFENNIAGGINLLLAMKAIDCRRIVFSSSCATYGVPATIPIKEDTPQVPVNPYGETKLQFERILEWCSKSQGLEFTGLRYFNACGSWQGLGEDHNPETHLIPNVLKVALGRSSHVDVFGSGRGTPDGTCVRDYIHVHDLAVAHALAIENGVCGFMNLGTGNGHSVLKVINTARKVTGKPIPIKVLGDRPGDPDTLVADASYAMQALGWSPQFSNLQDIIASAWEWHSANPEGYHEA